MFSDLIWLWENWQLIAGVLVIVGGALGVLYVTGNPKLALYVALGLALVGGAWYGKASWDAHWTEFARLQQAEKTLTGEVKEIAGQRDEAVQVNADNEKTQEAADAQLRQSLDTAQKERDQYKARLVSAQEVKAHVQAAPKTEDGTVSVLLRRAFDELYNDGGPVQAPNAGANQGPAHPPNS